MRKRKRFTSILLAATLLASLAGCSAASTSDQSLSTEASSSTANSINASGNDDLALAGSEADAAEETAEEPTQPETENTAEAVTAAESTEETADREEGESQTEESGREQTETTEAGTTVEATEQPETTKVPETTKDAEPTKQPTPVPTKVPETTRTEVKAQSITASVSGSHYIGDTLTGADFTVTVTMSDGTTLTNPAGWSASPLALTGETNKVTVSYQGVSTTVTVSAAERAAQTQPAAPPAPSAQAQETTADPHEGMVLADDGQWHETKANGEELGPGDVVFIDGQWHVLSENYGQPQETLIPDGTFSYEMARMLFDMENEVRAEAGSPPLIWSDELYEVAKQCAKACGDAGRIDHDLTKPFRKYQLTTKDGYVLDYWYPENLCLGGGASIYNETDMKWSVELSRQALINSKGHYEILINNSGLNEEGAVAVYRKGDNTYESYLFHHVDYDLYEIENY